MLFTWPRLCFFHVFSLAFLLFVTVRRGECIVNEFLHKDVSLTFFFFSFSFFPPLPFLGVEQFPRDFCWASRSHRPV